jgi:plastocyanin
VLSLTVATAARAGGGAVKGTIRGPEGEPVANAAVLVEGPSAPPAEAAHAVIEQRDQTFVPHVLAIPVGTAVDFPNHDPILHNVFSASSAKKFDLGMYDQGVARSVTFDAPGVVRIGCNVHPKMQAFVIVNPNPYVAVTDAQGEYTIRNVPAGGYQIRVWHERLVERQLPVVVRDGQVEPLDVRLQSP